VTENQLHGFSHHRDDFDGFDASTGFGVRLFVEDSLGREGEAGAGGAGLRQDRDEEAGVAVQEGWGMSRPRSEVG
jgi:hypothetical protein